MGPPESPLPKHGFSDDVFVLYLESDMVQKVSSSQFIRRACTFSVLLFHGGLDLMELKVQGKSVTSSKAIFFQNLFCFKLESINKN